MLLWQLFLLLKKHVMVLLTWGPLLFHVSNTLVIILYLSPTYDVSNTLLTFGTPLIVGIHLLLNCLRYAIPIHCASPEEIVFR